MDFTDCSGSPVVLGRALGRMGGEGTVYEIAGERERVAKIFHQPPEPAKVAKLEHLGALEAAASCAIAALPLSLLRREGGVCGYVMRRAEGREIHQLFGPRERAVEFPEAQWDFLVRVAENCAAAFADLHHLGVVLGDVNEGNVLVNDSGDVTLIDCDSCQVNTPAGLLTCEVGIEHWTPPELQGRRSFAGVERTVNHDLFGLAVLIFKLLFMGRHPYAGVPVQAAELRIEEAIAAQLFAFSPRAWSRGIRPPPDCLALAHLPAAVAALFEAAFLPGSEQARPSAARWREALRELGQQLATCPADPAHRYPRHSPTCPWCAIMQAGGPNFFHNIDLTRAFHASGDAEALWAPIANLSRLRLRLLRPEDLLLPAAVARPLPPEIQAPRGLATPVWLLGIGAAACFSGNLWIAASIGAAVAAALITILPRTQSLSRERDRRQAALDRTCTALAGKLAEMNAIPGRYQAEFDQKKSELRAAYDRLRHLDRERTRRLRRLQRRLEEMQRHDFLDQQLVSQAVIAGLTPAVRGVLLAYGIEAASDIHPALHVPGVPAELVQRLVQWRQACEGGFLFDPARGVPVQELHRLDLSLLELRRTLLAALQQGPGALARLGTGATEQVKRCETRLGELLAAQAQARADLLLAAS